MEQAIEGAESVHRVKAKPGRKPKAVMSSFSSKPAVDAHKLDSVQVYEDPVNAEMEQASQAYAMRVWSGQSVDLPPAERKERVFNALRGQNLPTDGIVFPA